MYHIIMAGGAGTRFWPLSRRNNPKQFLKLIDDKSLIQKTYKRLLKVSSSDKIFILSSKKYKKNILEQFPNINSKNLIFEPSAMNTTSAIFLACSYISTIDSNAIIGIYPADHYIENNDELMSCIKSTIQFIQSNEKAIVTLGIKPRFTSTSYGYISINRNKFINHNIYKVNKFLEKPNKDKAEILINNKDVFWNSGMFFFKAKNMIDEIEYFIPKIKELFTSIDSLDEIEKIWEAMPNNSIDYEVMEKTTNAYCMETNLIWSDLGTWLSLYEHLSKNKKSNVFKGKVLEYNSSKNLVITNKQTAIIGIENIAVINTDDSTLVLNLNKSDDVKFILEKLEAHLK